MPNPRRSSSDWWKRLDFGDWRLLALIGIALILALIGLYAFGKGIPQ